MDIFTLTKSNPIDAARLLLGKMLISEIGGMTTSGIIVETEAYLAEGDLAAHNVRGKTIYNKSLYQSAGTLYIHSMRGHHLIDIVVGEVSVPGSVLIRAIEPKEGLETMIGRRGIPDIQMLCNGPGKLCKALGIDKKIDGENIFSKNSHVKIVSTSKEDFEISAGSRIGITKNIDASLRFTIKDSKFLSKIS